MLINLHSHLEGRIRPSTAADLAAGAGLPEPEHGWEAAIRLERPADLTVYLRAVAVSYPFFDGAEALTRITREAVEDAAADGQDYLELRFGPATHVRDNFSMDTVVAAACEGLAQGSALTGMPAGLVVAALRHHSDEVNKQVAEAAARHAGNGVVGFDLAGDELLYPELERYVEAFGIARAAGLGLTCHAAEAAEAESARRAQELFGISRIGHGAHIVDDPDVLRWAADSGVVVEVCPTSNWYTGAIRQIADHPAPTFSQAGVPIVLGDDNPMQIGSALAHERQILRDVLGFGIVELERLDRTSVAHGFMEDSVRHTLSARLTAAQS